jgi:hypothetical protein
MGAREAVVGFAGFVENTILSTFVFGCTGVASGPVGGGVRRVVPEGLARATPRTDLWVCEIRPVALEVEARVRCCGSADNAKRYIGSALHVRQNSSQKCPRSAAAIYTTQSARHSSMRCGPHHRLHRSLASVAERIRAVGSSFRQRFLIGETGV